MSSKTLKQRRKSAIWTILGYSLGAGVTTGAPTPIVEGPKQVVLTAADFAMAATLHKIYFDEEISSADVVEMLVEFGLLASLGAGLGYACARGGTFIVSEITNVVPVIGWGLAGLLGGTITGAFGLACMKVFEVVYKRDYGIGAIPEPA